MFCIHCGWANADDAKTCSKCESPMDTSAIPANTPTSPDQDAPASTVIRTAETPPPPPERTSGEAIASLVLGILGFFTAGLTAVVGLILGILGARKIGRSGGRIGGQGLAVAGIVTSGISLLLLPFALIMAAILLPVFSQAREKAHSLICLTNLKQIAAASMMYTQDYDQAFPPSTTWQAALHPYIRNNTVFHCPSAPEDGRTDYSWNASISGVNRLKLSSPNLVVTAFDSLPGGPNQTGGPDLMAFRHDGFGNVAYADGHVQRVSYDFRSNLLFDPARSPHKR